MSELWLSYDNKLQVRRAKAFHYILECNILEGLPLVEVKPTSSSEFLTVKTNSLFAPNGSTF